jgi:hypothetical protein
MINASLELEDRFSASWDKIEQFYNELLSHEGWEWVRPITGLIRDLRKCGYDRQLRAGQSVWIFALSRSKEHGLRPDQHSVAIHPQTNGGMVIEYHTPEGNEAIEINHMKLCPELQYVLARLMEQEID